MRPQQDRHRIFALTVLPDLRPEGPAQQGLGHIGAGQTRTGSRGVVDFKTHRGHTLPQVVAHVAATRCRPQLAQHLIGDLFERGKVLPQNPHLDRRLKRRSLFEPARHHAHFGQLTAGIIAHPGNHPIGTLERARFGHQLSPMRAVRPR